jgi:hypothetical protein
MNNKLNKSLKIIDEIEKIRSKNNKNWMDMVRLSLKLDLKKTSKLINEIYKQDMKISKLAKRIAKD